MPHCQATAYLDEMCLDIVQCGVDSDCQWPVFSDVKALLKNSLALFDVLLYVVP